MVNWRSSSHHRGSAKSKFRFKASPVSVTVYTLLLFALSIIIFIFHSREILEEEQNPFFLEKSESEKISDDQLWGASFSYGFHPCVVPTRAHKEAQGWDHYITVRSNGGLNQMRTGVSQ
ncbi:O-fucosyltransferase 38-like [Macadamia integrifolia]|uniref:O-fucosyltransferase 38-like n=1 Tax=Macadamia integrifolia TaxID=60698 RepID=UPI001C4F0ADC|nr:O-fucosyltransferase 38-like [Macadamia integrifolia]